MQNKLKVLAGLTVATTVDRRGHATISGEALETLTLEPLSFDEGSYHVFDPGLPSLYAWDEEQGRALAVALNAHYEPCERLVAVHWRLTLPAGDLLFADWADVVLYARHVHASRTETEK